MLSIPYKDSLLSGQEHPNIPTNAEKQDVGHNNDGAGQMGATIFKEN